MVPSDTRILYQVQKNHNIVLCCLFWNEYHDLLEIMHHTNHIPLDTHSFFSSERASFKSQKMLRSREDRFNICFPFGKYLPSFFLVEFFFLLFSEAFEFWIDGDEFLFSECSIVLTDIHRLLSLPIFDDSNLLFSFSWSSSLPSSIGLLASLNSYTPLLAAWDSTLPTLTTF